MPKYTRKPHFTEEGTPHIYAEWNGKRVLLATVHVPEWHENRLSGAREAYANAVLYAAAPDLLEALRMIAHQAPTGEPEYDDWGGDTEEAERWGLNAGAWALGVIARTAIAKAEGRSS